MGPGGPGKPTAPCKKTRRENNEKILPEKKKNSIGLDNKFNSVKERAAISYSTLNINVAKMSLLSKILKCM